MGRGRLGSVALLCTLLVVGIPFPATARSAPRTVHRDVALEAGVVRASPVTGAWLERGVELPINANLLAVSFRAPGADHEELEEIIVEARTRAGAAWSDWQRLYVEPDEAPDAHEEAAATKRVFTSPLWVGSAREAKTRVVLPPGDARPRDFKLHLINTMGDAEDPGVIEKAVGAMARWLRGSSAHAMTAQPGIISRAQWGADESIRECCPRYAEAVHMAFVHHTAGTNSYSASQSAAIVRGIYAYHVKNRGWSDIGYNFLVDRHGQIFEGRAGGIRLPVIGAHVKGFNTGSTGISLMGTFTSASPTAAMVSSLQNLLAWKLDVHHVPPNATVKMVSGGSDKHPAGKVVTFQRISGHRDGQLTACPGTKVYNLLPSIRAAVNKIGLPKLYLPATSVDTLTPDGDGVGDTVTLSGSFTTTVAWKAEFRNDDGAVVRSYSGKGTGLSVVWDGRNTAGNFLPSGRISWSISGADDDGQPVMPASGALDYVRPVRVVAGDWDDDGVDTPGLVVGNKWYLYNDFDGEPAAVFAYGKASDRVVAGDWDGDGKATPGVIRGNVWLLNNDWDGTHDIAFAYGKVSDLPVVGDWNGNGGDTIGVVRNGVWFLNDHFDGGHDGDAFSYGKASDFPIAGDWDGNGTATPGVVRGNALYLNNNRDGAHDVPVFSFGKSTDSFAVGDWTGDGRDLIGVFRDPIWFLRDANTQGPASIVFEATTG